MAHARQTSGKDQIVRLILRAKAEGLENGIGRAEENVYYSSMGQMKVQMARMQSAYTKSDHFRS